MQEHTTIPFPHPQLTAAAPSTEVLRQGAQRLLSQALEVAVATAIPAEPPGPVITGLAALAFRKLRCDNTP